jgi:hypothetical protein
MNPQELMKLQSSSEAPFNHRDYTIWLHNQIVGKIRHEIEITADHLQDPASVLACLHLPSLKIITK